MKLQLKIISTVKSLYFYRHLRTFFGVLQRLPLPKLDLLCHMIGRATYVVHGG